MRTHYSPAAAAADDGWIAVVAAGKAVLVESPAVDERVDEVLEALESGGVVDALLGLLMSDGLSSMPEFAFAERDDSGAARVLVRGGVVARLNGIDYRGSDYST